MKLKIFTMHNANYLILWLSIFLNILAIKAEDKIKQSYRSKIIQMSHDQIEDQRDAYSKMLQAKYKRTSRNFMINGTEKSSISVHPDKKADLSIITIHGLYDDGTQFNKLGKYLSNGANINWFNVVLPGHGATSFSSKYSTHLYWEKEVEKILEMAKKTGNKVIIIGQSTGGLLALNEALKNQEGIDGLVLIEPAFKVNTKLILGTCIGSIFFANSSSLSSIAKIIGYQQEAEQDVLLSMGCEVDKLRRMIEERESQKEEDCISCIEPYSYRLETIDRFFDQIKLPTLVMNRPNDNIVSSYTVKKFASKTPKSEYHELDGNHKHGSLVIDPTKNSDSKLILSFINKFLPDDQQKLLSHAKKTLEQNEIIEKGKIEIDQLDAMLDIMKLFPEHANIKYISAVHSTVINMDCSMANIHIRNQCNKIFQEISDIWWKTSDIIKGKYLEEYEDIPPLLPKEKQLSIHFSSAKAKIIILKSELIKLQNKLSISLTGITAPLTAIEITKTLDKNR